MAKKHGERRKGRESWPSLPFRLSFLHALWAFFRDCSGIITDHFAGVIISCYLQVFLQKYTDNFQEGKKEKE